jgi:DNA-binding response OmpR family regulator
VFTCEPSSAADPESEPLVDLLDQLGCRVERRILALSGNPTDPIEEGASLFGPLAGAADVIIVDTGDDMGAARRAISRLRASDEISSTPILLAVGVPRLAALDFSVGFDDFVLRPFVPAELYARLRQIDHRHAAYESADAIVVGELVIDLAGREVSASGRDIKLTPQEFELLRFLAENLNRALERDEILRKVWGYAAGAATRTVDIHIRRLRAKLGAPWDRRIETVRHVGYKLK